MDKFGFIGHFPDIGSFEKHFPREKYKFPLEKTAEKIIEEMQPFLYGNFGKIKSKDGTEIEGYITLCPLLPKQFFELDEEFVLKKIIEAGRILKNLEVKIIGLGGFTSIIKDQGKTISEALGVATTTGNTYTVVTVIEAIREICRNKKIDILKSKVAVIGATGSIGSACTKVFAKECVEIIITARSIERLENLKLELINSGINNFKIVMDVKKAVSEADVVITVTSAPESILGIEDFKSGAIVCDVAVPPNVFFSKERESVYYFKGGLVQLPDHQKFSIDIGLPEGLSYGCLAETMILTFLKRFEKYVCKEIPIERLEELKNFGNRCGFKTKNL